MQGVGRNANTPSDNVVKMRIIGSDGKLRTYTKDDKEMLQAIRANFGCFGVIFDMTLKLIPEFIVKVENRYMHLGDLFFNAENIKQIFENNWSVEMFWFPFNSLSFFSYDPKHDRVLIRIINKESKKVKTETESYYEKKKRQDHWTQKALEIVSPHLVKHPHLTPEFAYASFRYLSNHIYPSGHDLYQELPHAVHFRYDC